MTATLTSTDDAMNALKRQFSGNDMAVKSVVTRVMLRTGVNLEAPRPDQKKDKALLTKLATEMHAMGITL